MCLKGVVHPKMKVISSLTQPHEVTNLEYKQTLGKMSHMEKFIYFSVYSILV